MQAVRIFGEGASVEVLKRKIEMNLAIHEPISGSVEIPLTSESKEILNLAFEEASELGHKQIGFEHLLIGILRCKTCMAAKILYMHGATIAAMRKEAIRDAQNPR
jgi:ATP-dependent Clp protease ATP-binding subunit ClpC